MKYQKTSAGQQALKDRSVPLSPRQRSAFILFDGNRTLADVLQATQGLGVTQEDVDYLVEAGLLARPAAPAPQPVAAQAPAPVVTAPSPLSGAAPAGADRYRVAYPLAAQLTATLGLRGYRLNLAVEAAGNYDELLALFPRIQEAVGADKAGPLEQALKG